MKTWHWIVIGTGTAAVAAFLSFRRSTEEESSSPARTGKKELTNQEASVDEIAAAYPAAAPVTARLIMLARRVGTKPQYIANVINFESRWDPAIVNKASGATGLIQFTSPTAKGLGTSKDDLAKMNVAQQFTYVEKYFLALNKKLPTQIDVFMAVFYPKAIGKSPDWIIGSERDAAYREKFQAQNPGIKTPADYAAKALLSAKL